MSRPLLQTLLRLLPWLLFALSAAAAETDAPKAVRGVLEIPAVPAHALRLEGEWALARGRFLDAADPALPDTFFTAPSPWNAAGGAEGWGTYALQVACPAGEKLALSVPAQRSAMRLFVNGRLVAQQGEPGASVETARPAMGPRVVLTEAFACPLALRMHVSNFNHRHGGMVRAVVAGPPAVLMQDLRDQLVYNTLMLGGYAVLGLLSLFFFAARRKDPTPLFFGLFCMAQALFADLMGERILLLSFVREAPWEPYLRIEYLAWFANMATFLVLVQRLFAAEMGRRAVGAFLGAIGLAMLFVAVAPGRLSSHVVPFGQVLCVAMGGYFTWRVGVAARRGSPDAPVMLAGLVFLLVVIMVDAALYSAGYWLRTLTPLGLLGFALAPGIVMARRLARALNAEELRALEQQLRGDLLVRTTQAGIFDWDTSRNRRVYSQRLLQMLGEPPQAAGPSPPMFHEFVHPDDREQAARHFAQALAARGKASGEVRHAPSEFRLQRPDGGVVWVLAEAISLTGSDGATLRFICSFLDISGRRAMEEGLKVSRDQVAAQAQQLRLQNEQLERDARLREDVERMSRHDLKTPLNSLIGVVRLLREDPQLAPGPRELLGIADRAGLRMLEMVNLSLDLFRMEQGSYVFQPQGVDLAAVAGRVLDDMRALAAAGHVRIAFEPGAGPRPVRAEELLCYSILANLVKNAVEATPPGGTVTLAFLPGTPVRLRIHNPGELAPAVARRFFDKYFSVGKPSGTGLGTYSARLMARVQQGDLALEAAPGHGVALVLTLQEAQLDAPAAAGVSQPAEAAFAREAPAMAGRLLLVDDDEFSRLLVMRMLPGPPLELETAVHGRAAVEAVRRNAPDVVLMDLEMPVMDGLEAIRLIRRHEEANGLQACAIVLLSSHDDPRTEARALEAGADHCMGKPVSRAVLLGMLSSLMPAVVVPQPAAAWVAAPHTVRVDAALLDEVPAFLASRHELMQAMDRALGLGERKALGELAHQCRGGLSLWGFDWAALQCERIEEGAGEAAAEQLAPLLAGLRAHLACVRVEAGHDA